MALTDINTFMKAIKKYTTGAEADKSLYDKSKCESFLSEIERILAQDPAHAQKISLVLSKTHSGIHANV